MLDVEPRASLGYDRNADGDECNDVKGDFFMGLLQAVAVEYATQV